MSIILRGKTIDDQTRCVHYQSALDVIAVKCKCCNTYYPCYFCHEEESGHEAEVWKETEFDTAAVLCGVCKKEMSIVEYKTCNYHCPFCNAAFNPKCSNHDHFYFQQ